MLRLPGRQRAVGVLVTGAVEVNTDSNKKIALTPTIGSTYTGGQLDVENVDASLYVSWVEGLYIYNTKSLESFWTVCRGTTEKPSPMMHGFPN
jgi:hypothetical protein